MMTSRERIFTAMDHRTPDRCPADFWGTREVQNRLKAYFGITTEDLLRDPAEKVSTVPAEPAASSPLSTEFYDLVDQLTLKELREIQAIMEEKINNRR